MNPQLQQILVYEEGDDAYPVAMLASLGAMADDNTAQTISISYGLDEERMGTQALAAEGQVLTQMVAQGQGVYASSGDEGAYGRTGKGLHGEDPGTQPLVTSVGGTTLFTRQDGGYLAEEAWNLLGEGLGATGGGTSSYWPIPDYQLIQDSNGKTVSIATPNGGSSTLRNFPDVAAAGNPATAIAIYSELEGGWRVVGGTSLSAPIWASFMTIASQARRYAGLNGIGFANPFLYSNIKGTVSTSTYDIIEGSNGVAGLFNGVAGFSAGLGYDNTTGLGSMASWSLLFNSLLHGKDSNTPPPDRPRGVSVSTTKTTSTVQWSAAANATGYLVLAYSPTSQIVSYAVTRDTQSSLQGFTPDTAYKFLVVSINKGGAKVSAPVIAKTAKN
ncbi:S53 family peptidase [Xanthomonas sp. GPE 39]|uniref:fibronectin type III domain-containing protein n=1 Tax=Xanthomonas sp. GPE 39 TaxID=1583099 RepID=UPI000A7B2AA5|nr:S53 family peptidase [Xanthomonas sp. GPE 39]